jgi:arylsulfatase A-like enzyme
LNRRYTQVHAKNAKDQGPLEMAKLGLEMLGLGLKPATIAAIGAQLIREKIAPHEYYRRVFLQPLVNYDVFETLYSRYRPNFATWHTGHCAHVEHHYWRAWDDSAFMVKATEDEKHKYGAAIELAYVLADELLGRFMRLAGEDTIVAIASGLGMQPYVKDEFPEGRYVVRFKDLRRVLDLHGAEGVTEVVAAMVPQWNVRVPDAEKRATLKGRLERARLENGPKPNAFHVAETGELLTVTPTGLAKKADNVRYYFEGPNANPKGYSIDELFAVDTPTPKQGYHHPEGVFFLHGPGIPRGVRIESSNNLDIAPTLLALQGIPVPSAMTGRVLVGERKTSVISASTSSVVAPSITH